MAWARKTIFLPASQPEIPLLSLHGPQNKYQQALYYLKNITRNNSGKNKFQVESGQDFQLK
jgi:hypothetical protein